MKGVSLAIETIIYLILAITVLSVLLFFFLTQAGPAQDQYTLEAKRDRYCATYTSQDFACIGKNGDPVTSVTPDVVNNIVSACVEMTRRFGFGYTVCDSSSKRLECIQKCCLTCGQR